MTQPSSPAYVAPVPKGLIKVVGMSASGKSTLVKALREQGYDARPISQEHANVPDLWRQFDLPDLLIYLDASLACQQERRPDVSWTGRYHRQEATRLRHARDHADLRIDTSALTPEAVLSIVCTVLQRRNFPQADGPLTPVTPTGAPRTAAPMRRQKGNGE